MQIQRQVLKVFTIDGHHIRYRPGTTDLDMIKEVLVYHGYRKKKIGFDVEPGEHWLDLGANIGAFAVYCRMRGAECTCFEPIKSNFKLLRANAQGALCYNMAVTAENVPCITLYCPADEANASRASVIEVRGYTRKEMVSNLYAGNLPEYDGVKMDIEGAEFDIIDQGLIPPCNKLVLEYHHSRDSSIKNLKRRISVLKNKFRTVQYRAELDRLMEAGEGKPHMDRNIFCLR